MDFWGYCEIEKMKKMGGEKRRLERMDLEKEERKKERRKEGYLSRRDCQELVS